MTASQCGLAIDSTDGDGTTFCAGFYKKGKFIPSLMRAESGKLKKYVHSTERAHDPARIKQASCSPTDFGPMAHASRS